MLKISSLKKLVTDSMAIDLGTASTIIAVRGRGIVVDEPSLVAINEITEEIVAFGQEAAEMTGRLWCGRSGVRQACNGHRRYRRGHD